MGGPFFINSSKSNLTTEARRTQKDTEFALRQVLGNKDTSIFRDPHSSAQAFFQNASNVVFLFCHPGAGAA